MEGELTDREKKIILIKFIIHGNSPYKDIHIDRRIEMLQIALRTLGIKYNDVEMQDIGNACIKFQQDMNDSLMGFLQNNKEATAMAIKQIGAGGDRFKIG